METQVSFKDELNAINTEIQISDKKDVFTDYQFRRLQIEMHKAKVMEHYLSNINTNLQQLIEKNNQKKGEL